VLLLLEAHCSQTRGLDIMLTKANFVIMSLSPHVTHKLQPLGDKVTGSLELSFTDKNGINY
jgi:hypothetical protein